MFARLLVISVLFRGRGLRRDCVSGLYEGVEVGVGGGFVPLLVISVLLRERGLRRDCVSGLYEGVGVGVGGVFSPQLAMLASVRGRGLHRDRVRGSKCSEMESSAALHNPELTNPLTQAP